MEQNNLNVWKINSGYNWRPINFFEHIKDFFKKIKWSIQRITKGYCDVDTWDMCDYIPELFVNMLKDYDANRWGYPGFPPYASNEEWSAYIKELIEEFTKVKEYNDFINNDIAYGIEEYDKKYEEARKHLKRALTLLNEGFFNLWD